MIVAYEVTNVGSDRYELCSMAKHARGAMASNTLSMVADRGYFKGEEILACHNADIIAYVPRPMTSVAKADGRIRCGEHEAILQEMQLRLSKAPDMMRIRKRTVEHSFETLK